jgi:ABC-2 type transport system permease protein
VLGQLFPLTHFIRAIRAVMLKGADLATISRELTLLAIFVAAYAAVALVRFRRTLD